jgi:hypothetical protein
MGEQQNTINYGPLTGLIGTWQGDKGIDLAPEPDGEESHPYYETLTFEAAGDVTNAGKQTLAALRYHQVVQRKIDDAVFHDETGYWMWDSDSNTIMHSLTIPRGLALLAGGPGPEHGGDGAVHTEAIKLEVAAKTDDPDWSIVQSPFMRDNAKTLAFSHKITLEQDRLCYSETTTLDIYGRIFEHTDQNELLRA